MSVLTALAWLVPYETAALSALSVYTIQLCTMSRHFMQSHLRKVHACLDVTSHMHFWQNDRGPLRATAVTRGWNRYRNNSQRRKVTLEKKIFPPLLQGFEPATFQSGIRQSNHWAIAAPHFSIHSHWALNCLVQKGVGRLHLNLIIIVTKPNGQDSTPGQGRDKDSFSIF